MPPFPADLIASIEQALATLPADSNDKDTHSACQPRWSGKSHRHTTATDGDG